MSQHHRLVFGRYDYAAFLSFFAYAAGSVVVPVALVQLARDLKFTLDEGGMAAGGALHLGRSIPMVVAMLACGFIAGRWGKRPAFGSAVLLMGLGVGLCALAPGYGILFLALIIAGLGEGTIEGLATPFIQDLHRDEPGRYINFTHGFWSVGVTATVLLAGALLAAGVSWRWLVGGVGCLALIPAALLLLRSPPHHQQYPDHPEPLHWRTVRDHALLILRQRRFWLFFAGMFLAGGGEFGLTFWVASYVQLNFAGTAWAGGAGTALFALGMVLGRMASGMLVKQHQLRRLILYTALLGTVVTAVFPFLHSLWAFFPLLFVAGLATAPYWPSLQSYCADRLPGTDTTMLFILLSCAGVPGCGVIAWLMGVLGNHGGLATAFTLIPACYLILALLVWWEGRTKPAPASPAASASPSATA